MPRRSLGVLSGWMCAFAASFTPQAALPVPIVTPVVTQRWIGPPGSRLGESVAAGDIDRDGIPDLVAGGRGLVVARSGTDGHTTLSIQPATPSAGFGAEVDVIGDATGDGVPDLVIADRDQGSVHLYSGTDGTPVTRASMPYAVTIDAGLSIDGLGDVDGDHLADFVIARRGSLSGADVFSGASGEVLRSLDDDSRPPPIATAATMGDLDGDGIAEVAIGYPFSTVVYSAATGVPQFSVPIADVVASADVDGDGRRDLLINQGPDVFLFSSSTGAPLGAVHVTDETDGYYRVSIARLGDVDGDGKEDFAASVANADGGAPRSGSVSIFSGATHERLARIDGVAIDEGLGWSLAGPGDVDGDGIPDLLVGAPGALDAAGSPAGAMLLYRLHRGPAPIGVDILPARCPNVLPARGNNAIEVTLYGAPGLDLTQIDPSLVRLAGLSPVREHRRGVDTGAKPLEDGCGCATSSPDGLVDRTFVFDAAAVRAALAASPNGRLVVTALLRDGRQLAGSDCAILDQVSTTSMVQGPPSSDDPALEKAIVSPSPARPGGTVTIEMSSSNSREAGRWTIYDALGRRIIDLKPTGSSRVRARWNGRDDRGAAVRPGIFFVRGNGAPMVARILVR